MRYEIQTSLDFEWSKRGWVANGPDFQWDLKSGSPTISNPNHLKSKPSKYQMAIYFNYCWRFYLFRSLNSMTSHKFGTFSSPSPYHAPVSYVLVSQVNYPLPPCAWRHFEMFTWNFLIHFFRLFKLACLDWNWHGHQPQPSPWRSSSLIKSQN